MKIVNILKKLGPAGGIETMIDGFLRSADQFGQVNSHVYGPISDHPFTSDLCERYKIEKHPGLWGLLSILGSLRNTPDVDVVLVHQPLTILVMGIYKFIARKKWRLAYFIHIDVDRIDVPGLLKPLVIRSIAVLSDVVLSETQDNIRSLKLRFPKLSCHVIRPPILSDDHLRVEKNEGVSDTDFVFLGRLCKQKDPMLFLDAFEKCKAYNSNVSAVIMGDGDLAFAVKSRCVKLGVTFTGRVDVNEIQEWFTRSKVFVMSSEYEGFGFVLIEALDAGLTVVSVDCPVGPREILAQNRGYLVERNPSALSTGMLQSLKAPLNNDHIAIYLNGFRSTPATRSIFKALAL